MFRQARGGPQCRSMYCTAGGAKVRKVANETPCGGSPGFRHQFERRSLLLRVAHVTPVRRAGFSVRTRHGGHVQHVQHVRPLGRVTASLAALRQLRELTGMTQAEVAARLEATQSHLSQMEAQDDLRLSTLRRYVRAIGGEVHLRAELNGKIFDLVI